MILLFLIVRRTPTIRELIVATPLSLSSPSATGLSGSRPRAAGWSAATSCPDPELPFKIGPMNGREARESGLRLKAWVAPIA